jgi:hypothetical protein
MPRTSDFNTEAAESAEKNLILFSYPCLSV